MESIECNSYKEIAVRQLNQISHIELNNPSRKNMLSRIMIEELLHFTKKMETDPTCRAIIINGKGNHFCAGTDLEWLLKGQAQSKQQNISDAKLFFDLYEVLYFFPKPVISIVTHDVSGGGIGILACSDIVIAHHDIRMSFPEVSLGLVPATIAPFVAKKTGSAFARRMMLTAETFTAQQAFSAGLVTDLVAPEEMEERLNQITTRILKNGPRATQLTKQMINHFEDNHEIDDLMAVYCTKLVAAARASEEGQEGVTAFLEKRKTYWNQ
ncbi:MAG: enoyl-CoA hydratase-related protein [Breznakibacter sp.]